MYLKFDVEKAIQAAGVLLRQEGKRMTRMRLLKLLLIADRRSIERTGRPILGSKIVAMEHGPLHSAVYDLIKGEHPDEARWSRFICRSGPRDVVLQEETDVARLSRHDIELLNGVSDEFAAVDDWSLSEYTHSFPEWKKNYRPGTSRPIPLEDVIEAVGRRQDAEGILQDLKDHAACEDFFARMARP